MTTIENWSIVGKFNDPYQPPGTRDSRLAGEVYNHPILKDGSFVVTSMVMHADGKEIITLNTKYILGKVSEQYRRWYDSKHKVSLNENNPYENK